MPLFILTEQRTVAVSSHTLPFLATFYPLVPRFHTVEDVMAHGTQRRVYTSNTGSGTHRRPGLAQASASSPGPFTRLPEMENAKSKTVFTNYEILARSLRNLPLLLLLLLLLLLSSALPNHLPDRQEVSYLNKLVNRKDRGGGWELHSIAGAVAGAGAGAVGF